MPRPPQKTVLYLSHAARPGGAEKVLMGLLGALDPARMRPVVAFAEEGPMVERLREDGTETRVLPMGEQTRSTKKDTLGVRALLRPGSLVRQVTSTLRYVFDVAAFARRCGAEVIHTNSMKAHLYGGLAGRWAGIPVVWHMHDRVHPSYLPRPAVWFVRALARLLPARVIAISESVLRTLRLPAGRGTVVHNGLPEQEIETLATTAGDRRREWPDERATDDASPVQIGMVGRLAPWKGQDVFLRAAAEVHRRRSGRDVHFQIIGAPLFGEDDYKTELHALTARLGLNERVTFQGFREDIPAALSELDILVHASVVPEPFGLVVIEGQASALPVVGSDGGGVAEVISHEETGLLYPMGDAGALAEHIGRLLDRPARARALGAAGQSRVRERFTIARVARQVQAVYDALPAAR